MIINGKAITLNDDYHFSNLTKKEQDTVCGWILANLIPRKTPLHGRTSYGIKHILESDTGIYTTNNQFKGAMLQCGFEPVNAYELNWCYCISKKSAAFKNKNI